MPAELARGYKNLAQRARVVSEAWGEENLYCPNCVSPSLMRSRAGAEAIDFTCPSCDSPFQLKSQSRPLSGRIVDAAYDAMERAIKDSRTPNLVMLHYDPSKWVVYNLVLIPRVAFSLSCLEKRPPLSASGRRHGWLGCNILLTNIPLDAKIPLVASGAVINPATVRRQYARLRPLEIAKHDARGWTLDVLNVVRGLGRAEFSLADVYAYEAALGRLHPDNRNIRPKIRQQLQILRDLGLANAGAVGGARKRLGATSRKHPRGG